MYKKWASYLSIGLLVLPLVARSETGTTSASEVESSLPGHLSKACETLPDSLDAAAQSLLGQFYRQLGKPTLWHDETRLQALRGQLQQLADDGLDPGDYPLPTHGSPACRELLTSHSFLRALQHLHFGRLEPARREPLWRPADRPGLDPRPALLSIAPFAADDPANAFDLARPALPAYQSLRQAYARLRLEDLPSWQTIADGPLLKPERHDPRIPQLYQRLHQAGYLEVLPESVGDHYDSTLLAAVERFQREHALQADGIIGPDTLAALNISPWQRRNQLRANLERLRWLHLDLPRDGLLINIAAAELRVYQGGVLQWQTRIQVGRRDRPSPQLLSQVSRLSLHPSWSVPPTIFREDKLPAIRRDPDFLARHDMRAFDADGQPLDPQLIDWDNPGRIQLRQAAGQHNPLGRMVLRFANPFSVYLHDTPSQALFAKAPRAFSSGCVRVEAVDQLITHLLAADELEQVNSLLASGKSRDYPLRQPVPLLMAYWTADSDEQGQPRYLPDIYRRDEALASRLGQLAPGNPRNPAQAAAAVFR